MTASPSIQPAPWAVEYLPYQAQDGGKIPNFRINDVNGDAVCETNEDLPAAVQEQAAKVIAAVPELLEALISGEALADVDAPDFWAAFEQFLSLARPAIFKATKGKL